MSDPDDPAEGSVAPERPLVERITGFVAVIGGLLALAVALLATASVSMRWLFNAPIDGDFEYVKMATAMAVFAYLPYTQARRGNIMVDTFTGRLSERTRDVLDAFWDIVYAGFMGFCTYALIFGTLATYQSGETTMQRQLILWPSIAIATALCGLLTCTALVTSFRLISGRR